MAVSQNGPVSVLKETWNEFSKDDCGTMAAALAYYTVFSLPAALLILIKIAGAVLGEAVVRGEVQAQISATMGSQVGGEIGTMVEKAAASTTGGFLALILGLAGLLWAASGITNQLQTALNRAWSVRAKDEGILRMLRKRLVSFLMIVGIGLLILVALAASAAATAFSGKLGLPGALIHLGEMVVTFAIFWLLFGSVFKVLPDAKIDWADVWIGGAVTSALFVIGKFLIGLYLGHSGAANAYGVAGSLALLLLWTYYSSMIFLLGAEFTQVWARLHGKQIRPDQHAVRVTEKEEEEGPRQAA